MTNFQTHLTKAVVALSVYLFIWYIVHMAYGRIHGILYALIACWCICAFLEIRSRFKENTRPAARQVAPWTWGRDKKENRSSDYACDLAASSYRTGDRSAEVVSSPVQVGSRTKWETKETK